jgi:hypothetical protein
MSRLGGQHRGQASRARGRRRAARSGSARCSPRA